MSKETEAAVCFDLTGGAALLEFRAGGGTWAHPMR